MAGWTIHLLIQHAVSNGDQPKDRKGARPHRAAHAAGPRRRGDRIEGELLRCISRLLADFVAEVGDYYARGLPRFVDTSSYYAAFGER